MAFCLVTTVANATSIPSETPPLPIEEWQPSASDSLVFDTKENIGYLVHEDGTYATFPIVSGQRRTVRYIGRTYNAKTPERSWTALTLEKKGDHVTFGTSGRFLRLTNNKNGEKTPYGIHSHRSSETMLAEDDRYRSMGCIIVSEAVLDVLVGSFSATDNQMHVITVYGVTKDFALGPQLQELIAKAH